MQEYSEESPCRLMTDQRRDSGGVGDFNERETAWFGGIHDGQEIGKPRPNKPPAGFPQHNNCNLSVTQILLVLDVLVSGEK